MITFQDRVEDKNLNHQRMGRRELKPETEGLILAVQNNNGSTTIIMGLQQ